MSMRSERLNRARQELAREGATTGPDVLLLSFVFLRQPKRELDKAGGGQSLRGGEADHLFLRGRFPGPAPVPREALRQQTPLCAATSSEMSERPVLTGDRWPPRGRPARQALCVAAVFAGDACAL